MDSVQIQASFCTGCWVKSAEQNWTMLPGLMEVSPVDNWNKNKMSAKCCKVYRSTKAHPQRKLALPGWDRGGEKGPGEPRRPQEAGSKALHYMTSLWFSSGWPLPCIKVYEVKPTLPADNSLSSTRAKKDPQALQRWRGECGRVEEWSWGRENCVGKGSGMGGTMAHSGTWTARRRWWEKQMERERMGKAWQALTKIPRLSQN